MNKRLPYLALAMLSLAIAAFAGFVVPLRASPGAVTLSWDYDATAKVVTIHLLNATNKDITAYAINVTIMHPDGNADTTERIADFLPLMASNADVPGNDKGTFAAGTSFDTPVPQTKEVTNVIIVLDVVAYLDGTAEVHNKEVFDHILAMRKALLLATQQASQAITKALTSPDPKTAAVEEIKRLADVAKAHDPHSYTDPNSYIEMSLRNIISEAKTRDNLDVWAKENLGKLAVIAPHTQLKEVKP